MPDTFKDIRQIERKVTKEKTYTIGDDQVLIIVANKNLYTFKNGVYITRSEMVPNSITESIGAPYEYGNLMPYQKAFDIAEDEFAAEIDKN